MHKLLILNIIFITLIKKIALIINQLEESVNQQCKKHFLNKFYVIIYIFQNVIKKYY